MNMHEPRRLLDIFTLGSYKKKIPRQTSALYSAYKRDGRRGRVTLL